MENSTKAKWNKSTNDLYGSNTHSTTVGKIRLSFDSKNLRLRAVLISNMTFIEAGDNNAYFKSVEEIEKFVEVNYEKLAKIKTFRTLIYTKFEEIAPELYFVSPRVGRDRNHRFFWEDLELSRKNK